ncbi:MAG: response regulator [Saprospiraceae bacterium]|nr:response regulator [Saprospiraceae bacterium]MCF8249666.1 response regulator [Saprospiraceae bacterium]MCF8279824.1 response regulator [Bacteroidales bacterium]MCF8312347.1 response regulator [Saprospiraceae bacterium]MCF8440656.1 response regulator [Saprospiraceae bacterium]
MSSKTNFIIVDDDKLVIMFCSMMIRKASSQSKVNTFEVPESGLEFIGKAEFIDKEDETAKTVLLLDINMPSMTGWEFLEYYDKLDEKIKDNLKIYILSSSVDARDMERAAANKYVKAFLVKPLTKEMLVTITEV